MSLRILAFSYLLPKPDTNAGDQRFCTLLEMLARKHTVGLCVCIDETKTTPTLDGEKSQVYRGGLENIGVRLMATGPAAIARALAESHYDVGFFKTYLPAHLHAREFRRRQPGAKVIVDSVDVHFAREASGAALGIIDPARARRTRFQELAAYRAADAVVAISDADHGILREQVGMPPIYTIPLTFPIRPRMDRPRAPEVVFVGSFSHHPNLDGINWFAQEIWPRVRDTISDAHLTIIGSNAPPEVLAFGKLTGVSVAGYVPDIHPYLDRAAVAVAPLRYGGGVKGKVIEAMACGVPVVTTSIGVQGLNAVSGEHLMLADEPDDFSQAVIALLKDPTSGHRLGLEGQRYVAQVCSPESIEHTLDHLLREVNNLPSYTGKATLARRFLLKLKQCRQKSV